LLLTARNLEIKVANEHIQYARILDRYYIPACYLNAFERGASHEYFLEKGAEEAVKLVEEIIKFVEKEIKQN